VVVGFAGTIKGPKVLALWVPLVANQELADYFVGLAVAAGKVTDYNYLIGLPLHERADSLVLAANCYS
jgi:hypothetical protein